MLSSLLTCFSNVFFTPANGVDTGSPLELGPFFIHRSISLNMVRYKNTECTKKNRKTFRKPKLMPKIILKMWNFGFLEAKYEEFCTVLYWHPWIEIQLKFFTLFFPGELHPGVPGQHFSCRLLCSETTEAEPPNQLQFPEGEKVWPID